MRSHNKLAFAIYSNRINAFYFTKCLYLNHAYSKGLGHGVALLVNLTLN